MIKHVPVLYHEVIDGLDVKPSGRYVDVTFGAGGHAKGILEKLDSSGALMAFDQDEDVWSGVIDDPRLIFAPANFRYLEHYLDYHSWGQIDGLLADLGVSSHHLDQDYRGFSYRFAGPLDMRMNKRSELTAESVVNDYSEGDLLRIFTDYGEVRNAKTLVRQLSDVRLNGRITTTKELVDAVEPVMRGARERYLAQVFQSIRIEVNDELGVVKNLLEQATRRLKPGGILAIISFHSLEDRLVKRWMKHGRFDGQPEVDEFGRSMVPFERGSGKLITAGRDELKKNPRSSSAKLRIGIKK